MTGKQILMYRIESLIGKGGMGSVYLASNLHIAQKVAIIKVLNRERFIIPAYPKINLMLPNWKPIKILEGKLCKKRKKNSQMPLNL
jgi:serine/threonine protein kinase